MGYSFTAVCDRCGERFTVSQGGGFVSELLHCKKCGRGKGVQHAALGDIFKGFIKGLGTCYAMATMERDQHICDTYDGPVVSEKEFHAAVEKTAGTCGCGGQFKLNAKPRCPKCRSTKFREDPDGDSSFYD